MRGCLPKWEELIDRSFLPEGMKAAYRELLRRRDEELIR
jgi:serine/threonine-protein kinase HipA